MEAGTAALPSAGGEQARAKGARARWKPGRDALNRRRRGNELCKGSPGPMEAGTRSSSRDDASASARRAKGARARWKPGPCESPKIQSPSLLCKGSPGPMEAGTPSVRALELVSHRRAKGARARWKPGQVMAYVLVPRSLPGAEGARARWKPGPALPERPGLPLPSAEGARARWKPGRGKPRIARQRVGRCRGSPGPMEAGTQLLKRSQSGWNDVQREPGPDGSRDD